MQIYSLNTTILDENLVQYERRDITVRVSRFKKWNMIFVLIRELTLEVIFLNFFLLSNH